MARKEAALPIVQPSPFCDKSLQTVKFRINDWLRKSAAHLWNCNKVCRHAKLFMRSNLSKITSFDLG